MPYGVTWKGFFKDLKQEISDDNVFNGAAALAYYLMLAIFPSLILLLSVVAYLPVENLDRAIMDMLKQAMPQQTADLLSGVVRDVTGNRHVGLLSFGLLGTLWASSSGMSAVMQQLNITYGVKEGRSFLKVRATALGLTFLVGGLIIAAFSMIVLGGQIQEWMSSSLGMGEPIRIFFAVLRWVIIVSALLLAFAGTYYYGPDVEQKFRFISPGAVFGVLVMVAASMAFRLYVTNFSDYSATYGSIGAVIVLMLWLNLTGLVMLVGSEINALVEHYNPSGKSKGEKRERPAAAA